MTLAAVKNDPPLADPYEYQSALDRLRTAKPERWRIDPIRTMDALYFGSLMVKADGAERLVLVEVIMTLLEEAAETEKSIRRPGPSGFVGSYPEVFYSSAEIKFAQNARLELTQKGEDFTGKTATQAEQASMLRHDEVTKWLRYAGGTDARKNRRILWLLAQGCPEGAVAKKEGLPNPRAVKGRRAECLERIADRLKKECPEIRSIFS